MRYFELFENWDKPSGNAFIRSISPMLRKHGIDAKIVGSVENKGSSENDLDLVLTGTSGEEIMSFIITVLHPAISNSELSGPHESSSHPDWWFFNTELPNGKIVEFYFHLPE